MDWTATLRSVAHRAQRAPHFLGRCGGFDERQTGPRQSIVHRVHYGRDRAERTCLADAFDAERVAVGQGRVVGELERAEIAGARHCVILERAGEQLAARRVVDEVLHQRLTDALDDPAVDLSLAEQRVQDPADIVDRDVAGQCDLSSSISTSQQCAPLGKVAQPGGPKLPRSEKPVSISFGKCAASNDCLATSTMPTDRSVPAIVNSPSLNSTSCVPASIIWAAILRPLSISRSAATTIAEPASWAERDPKVPIPIVTRSLSP